MCFFQRALALLSKSKDLLGRRGAASSELSSVKTSKTKSKAGLFALLENIESELRPALAATLSGTGLRDVALAGGVATEGIEAGTGDIAEEAFPGGFGGQISLAFDAPL